MPEIIHRRSAGPTVRRRLLVALGGACFAVACTGGSGAGPDPVESAPTTAGPASAATTSRPPDDRTSEAATVEQLEIESVRFPGRLWDPFLPPLNQGRPATIEGWLSLPAAPDPVPVVIIEHGCGGLGAGERDWGRHLVAEGIATLVLDSFGGRGVTEVCSGGDTVNVADLIVDVYRAADIARADPRIDGDRVVVMGFSFGGRTALWSASTRFQEAYGGTPFQGHVAFYPSTCYIRLEGETDLTGGPIRILHGTADDWTPIEPCQEHVDRLAAAGVDAALLPYPDAHHSFDNRSLAWGVRHFSPSGLSPRRCRFVEEGGVIVDPDVGTVAGVDSACVERGVSYAYSAEARRAAEQDLLQFLDEVFDGRSS